MILAGLHPKIHGRMAGLSHLPDSGLLRGLSRVLHTTDSGLPGGLAHPPGTTRLLGIMSYLRHPGKVMQPCSSPPFGFYLSPFGVLSLHLPVSRSMLIYFFKS